MMQPSQVTSLLSKLHPRGSVRLRLVMMGNARTPRVRAPRAPSLNNAACPQVARKQPKRWLDQPGQTREPASVGGLGKMPPQHSIFSASLIPPLPPAWVPVGGSDFPGLRFLICKRGIMLLFSSHCLSGTGPQAAEDWSVLGGRL